MLQQGITPEVFWSWSLAELSDYIDATTDRLERESKERICERFELAELISNRISTVFSDQAKPVMPWDIHGDLFDEEHEAADEAATLRDAIAQGNTRRAAAAKWNVRNKKGD